MDRRRPGQSKFTTQRNEADKVIILSGVFEGKTTGTPISILINNEDKRSRDYETIKEKFRPGHADFTYFKKYGIRDYRGGGRQSARETASRVAAGAVAKIILKDLLGKKFKIIGSAHNRAEIDIKKKQGCTKILLSRLFKTNYKNKKDYLGLIKFNLLKKKFNCILYPLGGIRISNSNRLKNINAEAFAILSEVKKKPAIISRLF